MGQHTNFTDTRNQQTAQERESLADELRTRHESGLSKLMAARDDLHGVHAHADFVADAVRWTA